MTTIYQRSEKALLVLNDLIKINDDRIACYEQALKSSAVSGSMRILFEEVINEAKDFKEELSSKLYELHPTSNHKSILSGIIHRAWCDLKVNLAGTTSNAVLNFCIYNEEIVQHSYKAAINVYKKINNDVRELIIYQQDALKRTYDQIKNHKQATYYSEARSAYFN